MFRASRKAQSNALQRHPLSAQNTGNTVRLVGDGVGDRRGRGTLCIVLSTMRGHTLPRDLSNRVLDTVEETYYSLSGSTTRALREAVLAGNQLVFEQNLRSDNDHRIMAGLVCVALRDQDAYISRLGPTMAVHVDGQQATQYPNESAWYRDGMPSTLLLNREPPLGARESANPDLFHVSLTPGQTLFLASSALASVPLNELPRVVPVDGGQTELAKLMADNLVQGVALWYGQPISDATLTRESDTMSLEPVVEAPRQEPVAPPVTSPPAQEPDPVQQRITTAQPKPEHSVPRFAASDWQSQPQETGATDIEPQYAADPAAYAPDGSSASAGNAREPHYGHLDHGNRDQDDYIEEPLIDVDALKENLSEGAERMRDSAQRLRSRAQDTLLQVLPDTLPERPDIQPTRRRNDNDRISLSGRVLVTIALAIPLVMLFIVIMTRIQYNRTRAEQFQQRQVLAQSRFGTAMTMDNAELKRQELYNALAIVEEGLSIDSNDQQLRDLKARIHKELDTVDNVTRLYHMYHLHDLDDEDLSPTDSTRIVVNESDVYVVNRGSDRVYKLLLNAAGDVIQTSTEKNKLVHKGDLLWGARLGDMVDIMWMAEGGKQEQSAMCILERSGHLLFYNPGEEIEVRPVGDSDMWLKPQAIGGYDGNLYVLDPLLSRILKYIPKDNSYSTAPSDYISPRLNMDLTGAVDMAIDSNVYVLFADGQIKKFYNGEPEPFAMSGLPTPMSSPTMLFVSGEQQPDAKGYVYVADSGNQRILQFDKEGHFLRQLQDQTDDNRLSALRGLYVDEESKRIFFVNGRTLWMTNLPALGE